MVILHFEENAMSLLTHLYLFSHYLIKSYVAVLRPCRLSKFFAFTVS